MGATNRPRRALSRFVHSYSLKLSLLAVVLLTVPVVLYWQFRRYERQQSAVLYSAVAQTSQLIAAMLRPHLANFHSEKPAELHDALASAAVDGVRIKVFLRPAGGGDHFFYITSYPAVSRAALKQEQRELGKAKILEGLAPACAGAPDLSARLIDPTEKSESLTSITPVHIDDNCWVVITSKNTASFAQLAPKHYFQTTATIQTMTILYVLSTVLILWLFLHLWRNVTRFRSAARHIRLRRGGDVSFGHLNTIPELRGVAEDFDSLVLALIESQMFIRRAAEENAHALKAPLAVIAQSMEPLKRAVSRQDEPAQRSLQLLERSILRLDALVSSVREMEEAAADVVYPECRLIDLSGFLTKLLEAYDMTLVAQKKRLVALIEPNVSACGNEDIMEAVIENLLENAASFTARGGLIEVTLEKEGDFAQIRVADRGPGVDPTHITHIFDRYVSFRAPARNHGDAPHAADCHQGLGLWIVKRNVEGLGGTVSAQNRQGNGFEVTVNLRAKL